MQRGVKIATVTIPATTNDPSHCTSSMTARMIGTSTSPPRANPVPRMPTANPRRRSNQREISVWKGMKNIICRNTALIDW